MNSTWRPLLEDSAAERALEAARAIADSLPAAEAPPPLRHASLAGGQAGQALFYAYLSMVTEDEAAADMSAGLLDQASEQLAETPLPATLYTGFPGVAWTLEHLQGRLFEPAGEDDEDPALEIDEALSAPLERTPWQGEYDLISGLTGLGVYALERLPRPSAAGVLERIVDRLAEIADTSRGGAAWFTQPERLPDWQREHHPQGNYNLGVAHGLPGVLPVLAGACAAGVAVDRARPLLDAAVGFLMARRLAPGMGSCFAHTWAPWEPDTTSRLAWCYGDPGIAASLLATARAVGEPAWEREALDVALQSAARPEATAGIRDAGLCHGAAGLGHLFNRMYQTTGEEPLAEAARFWFDRALGFRQEGEGIAGFRAWGTMPDGGMDWRTEPGFLEGAAGIGLALLGAVSSIEPAWDRILAVSLKTPSQD